METSKPESDQPKTHPEPSAQDQNQENIGSKDVTEKSDANKTTTATNATSSPSKPVELGKKKRTFKIIVIGDTGVGKTCLTYRFCSGKFPSTPTDATIGVDFREKMITIDNKEQVNL